MMYLAAINCILLTAHIALWFRLRDAEKKMWEQNNALKVVEWRVSKLDRYETRRVTVN